MKKLIKNITLGAFALGALSLVGCSTNVKIDQLSSDVQILDAKVNQLSVDLKDVSASAADAAQEAKRANERLDNAQTITHYKK